MEEREGVSRGTIIKIAIAVVLLMIAAGVLVWQLSPAPTAATPTEAWFYNVASGERFTAPLNAIPPLEPPTGEKTADGGPAGVKLHVFSCGKCGGDSEFVGYLETYTPAAKEAITDADAANTGSARPSREAFQARDWALREGRFVAKEESTSAKWVRADSPEGVEILDSPRQRCSGQPVPCFPRTQSPSGRSRSAAGAPGYLARG